MFACCLQKLSCPAKAPRESGTRMFPMTHKAQTIKAGIQTAPVTEAEARAFSGQVTHAGTAKKLVLEIAPIATAVLGLLYCHGSSEHTGPYTMLLCFALDQCSFSSSYLAKERDLLQFLHSETKILYLGSLFCSNSS